MRFMILYRSGERESEIRLMHDAPTFESESATKRPAAAAKR
jgi:hypothetical protein